MDELPHRRFNPLSGEWVLVSPHRAKRPWQGEVAEGRVERAVAHDPDCYLCSGNVRANGVRNPDYDGVYVFANDFAALLPEGGAGSEDDALFRMVPAAGEARVICFSSDHGRTLPQLSASQMRAVIDCWCDQSRELGARWQHVQIFENKGAMMGCSNPHPHGQVWAGNFIPTVVAREDEMQRRWQYAHGDNLLDRLVRAESGGERVIEESDGWLCVVPWWAVWPFETMIVSRDPVIRLEQLGDRARDELGRMLSRLTARYDNLFGTRFPYSSGWHGAPHGLAETGHWRLHMHFYPPLLRSASVRKFMVGFEMLGESQRDLTPEQAAERLRQSSPVLTTEHI